MYGREDHVDELALDDCWRLLRQGHLGRLATGRGPSIEIFPINYSADGQVVYLQTSVGTKTSLAGVSPWVAFEIDGVTDGLTWSVVVKGPMRRVLSVIELDLVADLRLRSASPGTKDRVMTIDAVSITGRRFRSAV